MLTTRDQQIEAIIAAKDIGKLTSIFFDERSGERCIRDGVCHESELWDYKEMLPDVARGPENDRGWSDLAATILGFHNQHGGLLFFGVSNSFKVPGVRTPRIDSKLVNEKLRRYIPDRIWVEFQRLFIAKDQTCVALIIVPPRGEILERFIGSSAGSRYTFSPKMSAIREGDSIHIWSEEVVDAKTRQLALPTIDNPYEVDENNFRLLRREFSRFVYREKPCAEIERVLADPRTSVIALTGIGGTGKTAIASWATKRAYDRKQFNFITSITAKDRALTTGGIIPLAPQLSNYESLLDSILAALNLADGLTLPIEEKAKTVNELITGSNGLLFVDNLETIDDARIIDFLETLPIGVKAITTSRTPRVRKYVYTIDPGPLTDHEIKQFVFGYGEEKPWIRTLNDEQALGLGRAADGMPLAIEWIIKRASSAREALMSSEAMRSSGSKKDELLEFCFRRVFDEMPDGERGVLRTLAAVSAPLGLEPIIASSRLGAHTADVLDKLRDDSLIQRIFDEESGTYRFTLLPLVRAFVSSDTTLKPEVDRLIRKRLTDWFEATDIKDPSLKTAERQQRQGRHTSDIMLVELGRQSEEIKSFDAAKTLYERAYKTGRNWEAAHRLAEIFRHVDKNIGESLRWYEKAAASAPKMGKQRGLIFREWGNVLKLSGEPDAVDLAISKFEESLRQGPDPLSAVSLAALLLKKGSYRRITDMRGVLWDSADSTTRAYSKPLLVESYKRLGDLVKSQEISIVKVPVISEKRAVPR